MNLTTQVILLLFLGRTIFTLGLFIPYHIVTRLVQSKWFPRKEEWRSLKTAKMNLSHNELSRGGECVSITESSTWQQRKNTFHYPSLMKCWSGWQSIISFIFSMGIRGIIRFLSTPMIKARQHLHARMEHTHIIECHSSCVMRPLHSNGAWCLSFWTW
jgi:hypothetical protein